MLRCILGTSVKYFCESGQYDGDNRTTLEETDILLFSDAFIN